MMRPTRPETASTRKGSDLPRSIAQCPTGTGTRALVQTGVTSRFTSSEFCMAKTKQQKSEEMSALEKAFSSAVSTVFVHFNALTVADETKLRRELQKEGVKYRVAKKTLVKRALATAGFGEASDLKGEVAIAADVSGGTDGTLAARLVHAFAKTLGGEKLSILGGIFEGRLLSEGEMREVATIPPVPVLRGMFVNVINAPIQRLVVVLDQVAQKK